MANNAHSKTELRRHMRRRRQQLSAGPRRDAARRICRRLRATSPFHRAGRIAIYLTNDGEIDVSGIASGLENRRFYVPVLPPRGQRRLWFRRLDPAGRLYRDRFGIPCPLHGETIRAEAMDLILVPLVAFDARGGRIGMGGGFYDASLSFLNNRFPGTPTRVLGCAYDFQEVEEVPLDQWDVPLHGVVTEHRYLAAQGS